MIHSYTLYTSFISPITIITVREVMLLGKVVQR